jgi:hypothetical protein
MGMDAIRNAKSKADGHAAVEAVLIKAAVSMVDLQEAS